MCYFLNMNNKIIIYNLKLYFYFQYIFLSLIVKIKNH